MARVDEIDLIEMVNCLQNKLAASGKILQFSLPQIVVVGCQSAGKSSVLESIIGREFLPRGTGVVTRRPTVIQLQPCEEVYAQFLHLGDGRITDFGQVKQEIIDETARDPGPTGFSANPITVKIFAPNVLKLTLVDMPGIIKNVVGNQTEESIEIVKNMILKYIEPPNSLILAVSPATQDIATSDSIEIAQQVDLNRERTLGVLTKLDLMDMGTHACEVLENRILPLARGYVGVLNRSQKDIEENKTIDYVLAKEKQFFENHPAYQHMADTMGSPYLQRLLHVQLREHIKQTLPSVRRELTQKLNGLRNELKDLDAMMGSRGEGNEVQSYFYKLVQTFIDNIHIKLFGNSEAVSKEELSAGAVINYKLHTDLQKILTFPTNLTNKELLTLIANGHGCRNIITLPPITLEAACGHILSLYKQPLEEFVDAITDILVCTVDETSNDVNMYPMLKTVVSYPLLRTELVRSINESIDKAAIETKDMLGKHIKAEMNFCNIHHWDFNNKMCQSGIPFSPIKLWNSFKENVDKEIKGVCSSTLADTLADNASADNASIYSDSSSSAYYSGDNSTSAKFIANKLQENDKCKENANSLAEIVRDYMHFVQKQIGDVTIKYIICFLVKGVNDFIRNGLMIKLWTSPIKDTLIEECEQAFNIRRDLLTTCADIEEALNAVQSF